MRPLEQSHAVVPLSARAVLGLRLRPADALHALSRGTVLALCVMTLAGCVCRMKQSENGYLTGSTYHQATRERR